MNIHKINIKIPLCTKVVIESYYVKSNASNTHIEDILRYNCILVDSVEYASYTPTINVFESLTEFIDHLKKGNSLNNIQSSLLKSSSIPKTIEPLPEKPYPKLMINKSLKFIILATQKTIPPNKISAYTPTYFGTVVQENQYQSLGTYSNCWDASGFEDYEGSVTLTQD